MRTRPATISESSFSAEPRIDRSSFARVLLQIAAHRQDVLAARNALLRLADPPHVLATAQALEVFDSGGLCTALALVQAIDSDRKVLGFLRLVWTDALVWVDGRLAAWPRIVKSNEFSGFLDSALARGLACADRQTAPVITHLIGADSPLGLPGFVFNPPVDLCERPSLVIRAIELDALVIARTLESLALLAARTNATIAKTGQPAGAKIPPGDSLPSKGLWAAFASPNPDPLIHRWARDPGGERQGGKVPSVGQEDQNLGSDPNVPPRGRQSR